MPLKLSSSTEVLTTSCSRTLRFQCSNLYSASSIPSARRSRGPRAAQPYHTEETHRSKASNAVERRRELMKFIKRTDLRHTTSDERKRGEQKAGNKKPGRKDAGEKRIICSIVMFVFVHFLQRNSQRASQQEAVKITQPVGRLVGWVGAFHTRPRRVRCASSTASTGNSFAP